MGGTGEHEGRRPVIRDGVLYGADEAVTKWVAQRIDGFVTFPNSHALGIIQGEDIVAGVVFEHFNGFHCEGSMAALPGSHWANRRTLRAIFEYPFVTMGCKAISALVPSTNLVSLNLVTGMGFQPEAFIKYAAHDGSSLVVLKMFRENCRWIKDYGKEERAEHS